MILRPVIGALLCSMLLLACTEVAAQASARPVSTTSPVQSLTDDLCGCFSVIDLTLKDAVIDQRVKRCMEDAIVYHPAAVRALIQDQPKQGTIGFDLGRTLGALLDRSCGAYRKVKDRLRPGRAEVAVRNVQS
jgi:hypothetical protein